MADKGFLWVIYALSGVWWGLGVRGGVRYGCGVGFGVCVWREVWNGVWGDGVE